MRQREGPPKAAPKAAKAAKAALGAPSTTTATLFAFLSVAVIVAEGGTTTTKRPAPKMRIVNGDNVDIIDYPYTVSIERNQHHMCGGAIIAKDWIVSARHCFKGAVKTSEYGVRVGTTERQFGGSQHPVDRIVNHPGVSGLDFDVSVLHVSRPFAFGQAVRPVSLPAASAALIPPAKKLQVTGYGAIGEGRKLSSRLLKAELTVMEHGQCRDFFAQKAGATITERMICAIGTNQDACQGDSGGPLVDSASKLVGIVSFGMGCGHKGYPGVYTNVAHKDIRSFIKDTTSV